MTQEVKICGVCRPEDAGVAARAGASWIGVILAPGRVRTRSADEAAAIFGAAAARRVGVFVDAEPAEVIAMARTLELDAVQLHGTEPSADVRRIRDALDAQVWKAVCVRSADDYVGGLEAYAADVDALLLDGWSPHGAGGVGASFDWHAIGALGEPVRVRRIVAGGLAPENVARAVSALSPDMVDVSSGVEDAPGRKSEQLIREFIAAVRRAGVDA
jgi:phosphoribosylanthranilate isomerase